MSYADLRKKLATAQKKVADIEKQMLDARKEMDFLCMCGVRHKFKDCTLIKSYYSSGGEWEFSEYQIVCPVTDNKNRILWNSPREVPWDRKRDWINNPESQFASLFVYSHCFKEQVDSYSGLRDADKRSWWNNTNIDKERANYGIVVDAADNKPKCTCGKAHA